MSIKLKLKKGDKVIVLSGKSKGTIGEILKVFRSNGRVLVRGANMVKRHTKPTQNAAGGIVEKENSINISNIAFYDEKKRKRF
jgi:large subunit ribosomal protein L24